MAGGGIETRVTFDKLKELQQHLSRGEINAALDDTCKEVSDMWYEDAHEITGELKASIGYETSGYTGRVFATSEHAIFEIERGGIHDFQTRGFTSGQRILKEKLEDLLST
jgi:hypothetical protein